MIKAVLIDIDNTLLDFDAYVKEAMRVGFERFGLGVYEDGMFDVFHRINTELWQRIEQGSLTFDELMKFRWNTVFEALGISFDGCVFERFFRGYLFDSAIPVTGAMELLEYLRGRYILCVASNGPYEQQRNRLKVGNMLPYFSEVFVSERIGASKPSKEFFSHCLKKLNETDEIHPSEVMMIGDSLTSDMVGAIDSGLKTCFFDRTDSGKGDGLPIDYIVHSLCDIRAFL